MKQIINILCCRIFQMKELQLQTQNYNCKFKKMTYKSNTYILDQNEIKTKFYKINVFAHFIDAFQYGREKFNLQCKHWGQLVLL